MTFYVGVRNVDPTVGGNIDADLSAFFTVNAIGGVNRSMFGHRDGVGFGNDRIREYHLI